jgi:transcriptional regulator with XRE-family HTH domain
MQIGEKIKNYRKTAGLTQEQVADYLDVSTPAVNKWEKGNTYPDILVLLYDSFSGLHYNFSNQILVKYLPYSFSSFL